MPATATRFANGSTSSPLAATSFYRGGTVVPFVANAWDPVNDNDEVLWNVDYYYTNNLIFSLQQKFFFTYGSTRAQRRSVVCRRPLQPA